MDYTPGTRAPSTIVHQACWPTPAIAPEQPASQVLLRCSQPAAPRRRRRIGHHDDVKSQLSLSGLARLLTPLGKQFAFGGRVQHVSIPKPIYSVLFAKGKVKKATTHEAAFRRRGEFCVTTEASHIEGAHLIDHKYVDHLDRIISCLRVALQGLDSEIEAIYSTLQLGLASGADSQQPLGQQDNMVGLNPQVHAEFDRFGLLLNPLGQAN